MTTLKEYALKAWSQEQQKQKQAEQKKLKRRAKKIEEEIDDFLPRDSEDIDYHRDLEDSVFGVVVSISAEDGVMRFTRDDRDKLVILGECPACHHETLSSPIDELEDLGKLVETFAVSDSHECSGLAEPAGVRKRQTRAKE